MSDEAQTITLLERNAALEAEIFTLEKDFLETIERIIKAISEAGSLDEIRDLARKLAAEMT